VVGYINLYIYLRRPQASSATPGLELEEADCVLATLMEEGFYNIGSGD